MFFNLEQEELSGIIDLSHIKADCKGEMMNGAAFEYTGESISKGLTSPKGGYSGAEAHNQSLYSGGSSLIGLNYAFGGANYQQNPQEIMVLKI